jgi:arylsulfatase A-like enzyme
MIRSYRLRLASFAFVLTVAIISVIAAAMPSRAQPLDLPPQPNAVMRPNIIFIIVDALRADHVSAYGYARATTPNLDAWVAAPGARFTDVSASTSWTYPANATLETGRYPATIGLVWSETTSGVPVSETLLAEYLHDDGYYTAGFNSADFARSSLGFAQGFDVFQELIRGSPTRTYASEINTLAINWLDTTWVPTISGTQPLFLYLYYFDPHTYYNPLPPYDTLFDAPYTGTVTADVFGDGVTATNGSLTLTPRDVEHIVALYDGDIAYWDNQLGQMLTHLSSLGLLDNSLIVVTSDHGEMFGEHGKWTHRNSLYEEVLRVPLMIRYTGVITASLVITAPVQSADVVPTLLDLLNEPLPSNSDGLSLKGALQGHPLSLTRPIFSEMDTNLPFPNDPLPPRMSFRAVKQAGWKLIHPIGQQWAEELYQVQPHSLFETDNVIQTQSAIADQLRQVLNDVYHLPVPRLRLPRIVK